MAEELKACPFCGGTKIKKNSDDGQFWDTCQTCFADGPPTGKRSDDDAPDWNTRAQLPGQGGEAVAWVAAEIYWTNENPEWQLDMLCEIPCAPLERIPLYTHPADQVAEGVVVSRELLERALIQMEADWYQIDSEWGPTEGGLDGEIAIGCAEEIRELRALLAKSEGVK